MEAENKGAKRIPLLGAVGPRCHRRPGSSFVGHKSLARSLPVADTTASTKDAAVVADKPIASHGLSAVGRHFGDGMQDQLGLT